MFRRKHKHRHDWHTIGGWGVVECRTCGYVDLY